MDHTFITTGIFRRAMSCILLIAAVVLSGCGGSSGPPFSLPSDPPVANPILLMDLASFNPGNNFLRVSGSPSTGRFGVPVAAGFDCNGDGLEDFAMSAMQAAPFGRTGAGQVHLIFGDGAISRNLDTATASPNVLIIAGSANAEAAGSEIWMDDVTGDGIGDLLIARQNFRDVANNHIGAGALSIIVGSASLSALASGQQILDLANPPAGIVIFTLVGETTLDRFGMWMRTGDVTGDGVADVLIGADQADTNLEADSGAAYLVRGGAQLNALDSVKLGNVVGTALEGHIAKITPPTAADDYHFGATVALGDLDNNGRDEVFISASLSRVGGLLLADGAAAGTAVRNGGNPGGSLFILWDDNFPAGSMWSTNFLVSFDGATGGTTRINGGSLGTVFDHERFGEDVIAGADFNADGFADLFVGDIKGDVHGSLTDAGVGHVFFSASALRDRTFSMGSIPSDLGVSHLLGPEAGAISSDTSAHGDFNGDGIDDLAISSPLANPLNRTHAGILHVLWGQTGAWPTIIDLAVGQRPDPTTFFITDIWGAHGAQSSDDTGDTLMYSAATGDLDSDGKDDLVVNEMRGNGVAATALDVGNLIVIGGELLPQP